MTNCRIDCESCLMGRADAKGESNCIGICRENKLGTGYVSIEIDSKNKLHLSLSREAD